MIALARRRAVFSLSAKTAAAWRMVHKASQHSVTISQAPSLSSPMPKYSTSIQPTTRAESPVQTKGLRRCQPWTASSASRITSDSSGTALTARSLADRVSTVTHFLSFSYFLPLVPTTLLLYLIANWLCFWWHSRRKELSIALKFEFSTRWFSV